MGRDRTIQLWGVAVPGKEIPQAPNPRDPPGTLPPKPIYEPCTWTLDATLGNFRDVARWHALLALGLPPLIPVACPGRPCVELGLREESITIDGAPEEQCFLRKSTAGKGLGGKDLFWDHVWRTL